MRDIKTRIKSITSTEQITKAMKLVSSVKLQKERERYEKNKFYVEKMKELIDSIAEGSKSVNSIYLTPKGKTKKIGYIVISSDRGLCGGYNQNVFKMVAKIRNNELEGQYFAIGKKVKAYLTRSNMNVSESYFGISEEPKYEDAKRIGKQVLELYKNGEIDEVKLIYTAFHSIIHQEVSVYNLLPHTVEESKEEKKMTAELNYEPSEEAVFNALIPRYVYGILFGAMIESSVCEEASRMTAMNNATDNAIELVDSLKLKYNRVRQAAITKEITEIVGGANALQ